MKHIVERAIVPRNPSASSIINNEKYNLFAPVAGANKVGMAGYNREDFDIKDQIVSLNPDVKERLDTIPTKEECESVKDAVRNSEGFATGTYKGIPVDETSPFYENNAKFYASTAESYYQKRTWNHIISSVEEFKDITTMTGAILVRGVKFTGDASGTYNLQKAVTQITFQDCSAGTTLGNMTLVAAEGSDTELIGFYLPVIEQDNVFRSFSFYNFRRVHDVRFNKRQNLMCYYNCSHISDCTVSVAHNCTYIENCRIFNDGIPDFLNCKAVCGIAAEPAHISTHLTTFTNCSFLMNIAVESTYYNCTYVDETTCVGYVKAIDEGKVRVLNSTGTLDAVSLVQRVSLDLDRSNYLLNVNLSDANGALISTASVDLPLEEMIVNVAYIEDANTIVFYLRTGAELEVPLKNIVASSDSIKDIQQTVESEGDQGVNVWQLTTTGGAKYEFYVRNGSQGSPGYSPILGVDYFTPADKQEIYDYIDDNILGGEF